jgi:hypothetical protein
MELLKKKVRKIFLNLFKKRHYTIYKQIVQHALDTNKKYAVIRDNGNIIVQFNYINEAKGFSEQLNLSYKENGLRVKSSVINLQDYINSKKELYYIQ